MKIAIIGCGSIGKRHSQNLISLGETELIFVDSDITRIRSLTRELGLNVPVYTDYRLLLEKEKGINLGLICTPTFTHIPIGLDFVEAGINVFMEKPLSQNRDGVELLNKKVKEKKVFFMLGMCYRFNPALLKLKEMLNYKVNGKVYAVTVLRGQYLPDWRPKVDYRTMYSARQELGGGVILDSIHTIDIIRWLFGEVKEVTAYTGKLSDLNINTEDFAVMILVMESGIIVEVQLNYLQKANLSRFEVIAENGNLEWDLYANCVKVHQVQENRWDEYKTEGGVNAMYVSELQYCLKSVKEGLISELGVEEGDKTLTLALAVKKAAECKRYVYPKEIM